MPQALLPGPWEGLAITEKGAVPNGAAPCVSWLADRLQGKLPRMIPAVGGARLRTFPSPFPKPRLLATMNALQAWSMNMPKFVLPEG